MWGPWDLVEREKFFSDHGFARLRPWVAVDLVLLQGPADARAVDRAPSLFHGMSEKPSSLKVIPEEKAQVRVLVERVVQLIRDGVTGMDLLEVFLRRRI